MNEDLKEREVQVKESSSDEIIKSQNINSDSDLVGKVMNSKENRQLKLLNESNRMKKDINIELNVFDKLDFDHDLESHERSLGDNSVNIHGNNLKLNIIIEIIKII